MTVPFIVFLHTVDIDPVSITPSAPLTVFAGEAVDLECSVDITPHPLPDNTSAPEFEWFFGQTFNQPLTSTTTNSGSTYTSTYIITSASESDEGMYTCRLRGNQRTAVSTMVTVEQCKCIHLVLFQCEINTVENFQLCGVCVHLF